MSTEHRQYRAEFRLETAGIAQLTRGKSVIGGQQSGWKNLVSRPSFPGSVWSGTEKTRGKMFFRVTLFIWEFVLDVIAVSRLTDDEKEVEILLLRQQLRIVERKQGRGPQIPRWQKVPLVALVLLYWLPQMFTRIQETDQPRMS
jgi:hypothetical protein